MGAEVQKAQHEVARPAPGSTAAPHTPASVSAAAVRGPQSLIGNSALKQRTATPPGEGPSQALLALQGAAGNRAVQRWAQNRAAAPSTSHVHRAAQAGVTGPGERLPHHQAIQRSFGPAHDLSGVRAYVGGPAARASQAMHATAFTAGEHVGFKASPDLWLAAHEAAHVVQQRGGVNLSGGVGRTGDPYERQADEVADRVASGRPAHDLLAGSRAAGRPAVQRCGDVIHEGCECAKEAMHAEETADETSAAVQRNGDGGFLEGVGSALSRTVSTVESAAGEVAAGVESAASKVASGVESVVSTVASGVESVVSTVASDVGSAIGTGIKAVESGVSAVDLVSQAFHLAEMAMLDPLQIPALLAQIAWDQLPAQVKALIINRLLDACAKLLSSIPAAIDPYVPSGLVISPLVVSAAQGFLTRARSFDDDTKVKVVDRFARLWANPSPAFTLGFLKGLLLGLWDGLTGPFVLLWDLVKLEWGMIEAEYRTIVLLSNTDRRRQLFAKVQATWAAMVPQMQHAIETLLASQSDPAVFIKLLDRLAQALLKGASAMGAKLADSMVAYIMQPDEELGESLGRIEGNVLFQVLLIVLSAGGWAALSAAIEGIEWIADALEALQNVGKAIEGLVTVSEAFARFTAFLRESKVLAELVDILEEAFSLFIEYLRLSYGLEGGAERGAAKGAEELGQVFSERTLVNELGEEHSIATLLDGSIIRCSGKCEQIAQSLAERAAGLSPETRETGIKLSDQAAQLYKDSVDLAAKGLSTEERAAQLKPLEDEAERLERQMSLLEKREQQLQAAGPGVNAAGEPYPQVIDPRTGQPIPAPPPGLTKVPVSERVPWGPQERGTYIKQWYDSGYPTPAGGWSDYDIHHIIPREYGGTNDFANLVPALRTTHQQEINPWWINYGD